MMATVMLEEINWESVGCYSKMVSELSYLLVFDNALHTTEERA